MTLPATQTNRDVLLTSSSEAASLMEVIARASRDTTVDVAKLERLMAMYERIEGRKAEEAFNEAMSAAQQDMKPIAKDATGEKGKYASYAALDTALRPIYTKHELSLSFNTAASTHETMVRVLCYVTRGGYTREYSIDMPADGKGPKGNDVMTRTHATGSAVTYGMRYLLKMIFNVAVEQDDDGKAAGRTRPAPPRPPTESQFITADQVGRLRALLDGSIKREEDFCDWYLNGSPLEDISPKDFVRCCATIEAINAKRARQATQLPAEPFRERTVPSMPPKLKGASTIISNGLQSATVWGGGGAGPPMARETYDPDTGEVTAPLPTNAQVMEAMRAATRPTQRPGPPRPVQSAGSAHSARPSTTSISSGTAPAVGMSQSDLPWEDQVNALVEDKPPAIANINILMKWQARCFELMPDKETAAEFHWEHIHADGPSRWLRDIPHPANADALQGAWNLLMKRFD